LDLIKSNFSWRNVYSSLHLGSSRRTRFSRYDTQWSSSCNGLVVIQSKISLKALVLYWIWIILFPYKDGKSVYSTWRGLHSRRNFVLLRGVVVVTSTWVWIQWSTRNGQMTYFVVWSEQDFPSMFILKIRFVPLGWCGVSSWQVRLDRIVLDKRFSSITHCNSDRWQGMICVAPQKREIPNRWEVVRRFRVGCIRPKALCGLIL